MPNIPAFPAGSRKESSLLKRIGWAICLFLAAHPVLGQETVPELELKEYQIIGRDTRVFEIEGDRRSSVWFNPAPIVLPEEERSKESSQGLIGDEERQHRTPEFLLTQGLAAEGTVEFGAHSSRSASVTASVNNSSVKTVLGFDHRAAKEHTRENRSPGETGARLHTYFRAGSTDVGLHGGFVASDDDLIDNGFRPGSRKSDRYTVRVSLTPSILESWETYGDVSLEGGAFENFGGPDEDESNLRIHVNADGTVLGSAATVSYKGEFLEIGNTSGMMSTIGGRGEWLVLDMMGITLGADVHIWEMPGGDTEITPAPAAKLDLAITKHGFARLSYGRGVIAHSFRDLYERNGLLTNTAGKILFEERLLDFDSEIGVHLGRTVTVTAGAFIQNAERPPLFTSSGDFFDVLDNTDVEKSGFRSEVTWNNDDAFGIDALFISQDAKLANDDDAPFIPDSEMHIDGWWILSHLWTLRSELTYYGSHTVDITDPSISEDGFFTVDVGVDRTIYKQFVSMYLDIRNLTNSDGAWWSGQYSIPGVGLYLGIRAHY